MQYKIKFTPFFERQLKKLKKKDKILFKRLASKIEEIQENPEHYKPLKKPLQGKRSAHLNPFVIVFDINKDLITFHYVKHHDDAY